MKRSETLIQATVWTHRGNTAQGKEPDTKDHILCDSRFQEMRRTGKVRERKWVSVAGVWGGWEQDAGECSRDLGVGGVALTVRGFPGR